MGAPVIYCRTGGSSGAQNAGERPNSTPVAINLHMEPKKFRVYGPETLNLRWKFRVYAEPPKTIKNPRLIFISILCVNLIDSSTFWGSRDIL